jgi:L-cysteine:1D-myo-inositol 2-amino-2-deoxy-alpha-D-glucopyranoside ligase
VAPALPLNLRLFDTRRGGLHPLESVGDGPIGLYVCGITPYDTTHLGHAFTYLAFDVLVRYLEYLGHPVHYAQNLTDVDDDTLRRAREQGTDFLEMGRRHTERFLADMTDLNWRAPDTLPRATTHIPQMVEMAERLLDHGLAYRAGGYMYLSAAADPEFGSLAHVPPEDRLALANERGNHPDQTGKRDPLDPVLWQPSEPDEPTWPAPWGEGRPGWHIQCSAMSVAHLGPSFALHGGGQDLAFPHHEFERVQSEGATGVRPVAGHWIHTGMLHHAGAKMAKSTGNLVMVQDVLRRWPADAIRLALVRNHYRTELTWTDALATAAATTVEHWNRALAVAPSDSPQGTPLPEGVAALRDHALRALDDDLDIPRMVGILDQLAVHAIASDQQPSERRAAGAVLHDLATRVLGLRLETSR